jgi:hypothetical protein
MLVTQRHKKSKLSSASDDLSPKIYDGIAFGFVDYFLGNIR